jgi:hypothetical protein
MTSTALATIHDLRVSTDVHVSMGGNVDCSIKFAPSAAGAVASDEADHITSG